MEWPSLPITLEQLSGTLKKGTGESRRVRMSRCAMELEETYMMVMTELEVENDTLHDGAVEVEDSEVNQTLFWLSVDNYNKFSIIGLKPLTLTGISLT
jgi:hypothetical protein